MKLDIALVQRILETIEREPGPHLRSDRLAMALGFDPNDDAAMAPLAKHIQILGREGFLDCDLDEDGSFGFSWSPNGHLSHWGVPYSLSLPGHVLLDALRDTSLREKVIGASKDVGVEDLRNIPGLTLHLLFDAMKAEIGAKSGRCRRPPDPAHSPTDAAGT